MENSNPLNKRLMIIDYEKFRRKIRELGIEQVADKIAFSEETVKKWIYNDATIISENIQLICDTYNMKPEDLGAEWVEEKKYKKAMFSDRLKNLIEEKGLKNSDLAKKIGVENGSVSNWLNKEMDSLPRFNKLRDLATFFKVPMSYLLGETNVRNADDEVISTRLGMDEQIISTRKTFNDTNIMYGKKTEDAIKAEFGFNFNDILNFIGAYKELAVTFYTETERIFAYYTNSIYRGEFEHLFNEFEVNADFEGFKDVTATLFETQTVSAPYNIQPELVSKAKLHEVVDIMFDEFLKKKENEFIKRKEQEKEQEQKNKE